MEDPDYTTKGRVTQQTIKELRRISLRRLWPCVFVVLTATMMVLTEIAVDRQVVPKRDWVTLTMLLGMGLTCISGLRWTLSVCPGCGNLFFVKSYWSNPFSRKCLHCGLPLRHGS